MTYPTPNVPRLADGQPDLKAPPPRQPDGKPDFIGFWQPDRVRDCTSDLASRVRLTQPCQPGEKVTVPNGPASVPGGLPLQPWAAALAKQRTADLSKTICTPAANRIEDRGHIGSRTTLRFFMSQDYC